MKQLISILILLSALSASAATYQQTNVLSFGVASSGDTIYFTGETNAGGTIPAGVNLISTNGGIIRAGAFGTALTVLSNTVIDGLTIIATNNGSGKGFTNASTGIRINSALPINITIQNVFMSNLCTHTRWAESASVDHGSGILIYGSGVITYQNITISNVVIKGVQIGLNAPFGTGTSSNILVTHCDFSDCNWGNYFADAASGSLLTGVRIEHSYYHDWVNWDDPGDTLHHNGCFIVAQNGGWVTNFVFYANTIGLNYGTYSTAGLYANSRVSVDVVNNYIMGSSGDVPSNAKITIGSCFADNRTRVYNNTFIGAKGLSFGTSQAATNEVNSYRSFNNCFYSTDTNDNNFYMASYAYVDLNNNNIRGATNNYFGFTQFNATGLGGANVVTFPVFQSYGYDLTSTTNNPHLDANYKPQSNSGLIARGMNLSSEFTQMGIPLEDAAGNSRPSSGAWDIGAYQYVAPTAAPTKTAWRTR